MNPEPRPSLTIFVQNKIGGVQFYYANLLGAGAFRDFDVRYIALDNVEDGDTRLKAPLEGARTEIFLHRQAENPYCMFRRLARRMRTIPPGLVLTNLPYELGCLDVHRRPDLTVAHVCHDELYVDYALNNAHVIDLFIAHNPHFAERLKAQLPSERAGDVYFVPFGIRQDASSQRAPNPDKPLRVVFIGRIHQKKGVLELPKIDDVLRQRGHEVQWSILGSGPDRQALEAAIAGRTNFAISSPEDGPAMLREAAKGDVFILPSYLDGTPLAVMEAMSVGLVPVISEFNPGAHWMAPPETGFVCPVDPERMASLIAGLDSNRADLEARSQAALRHARAQFAVESRAKDYAALFERHRELKREHPAPRRRYGAKMDRPWMPNPVVLGLRRVQRWARSRGAAPPVGAV